jgi:hypothetical protein
MSGAVTCVRDVISASARSATRKSTVGWAIGPPRCSVPNQRLRQTRPIFGGYYGDPPGRSEKSSESALLVCGW